MKNLILIIAAFCGFAALACNLPSSIPILSPSPTPTEFVFPTPVPPSPTPTPPPTPTPTPTPLPGARIDSGERLLFYGDWQGAISEFQSALESARTSADVEIITAALLGLGKAYTQLGDSPAAITALEELVNGYPDSPNIPYAHIALAEAFSLNDNHLEASESYLNYLVNRPGLIDAYILNRRADSLTAAGDYGGALIDYRAALEAPSFLNGTQITINIANAHASVGDYGTALGIYEQIYLETDSDFTRAQMDLLMGRAYEALGQLEDAYRVYQDSVNNYPTAYDSYTALLRLVEDEIPVDELNRGIVDYYAGQYGVALAAFDRYLQGNGIDSGTARYYMGLTQRALGAYDLAIAEWDRVILENTDHRFWDDAWEQKAYTQWAFQADYPASVSTLINFVSQAPENPRAAEFLFDAALVSERDQKIVQAAELWERVVNEYPNDEQSLQATFLAGFSRYRSGDYPSALPLFQRYLAAATDLEDRAAAYLWQAKTSQAIGDPAGTQTNLELAANTDPTGYYSERARDLLRGIEPFSPPQQYDLGIDLAGERQQAETWMRTTFSLGEEVDLSSPGSLAGDLRFQRGTELWMLGMYEQARLEFEDLRTSLQSDPVGSYRLMNYLYDLGVYRSAILTARQVLNLAGMSDAETMGAPILFNHIRFGTYFSDLILPVAQANDIHPLIVFSLVRQESAFEGFVRSSAGARGLMQIMPATGQEIATDLNWPQGYTNEDLYRPIVSINLGVDYLVEWRDRLGGDLYAALAAYNGGPGNALRWQELAGDDQDVFLEIIRFQETRNYIRSVYEIFNIYRRIYDRTP